MSPDDFRRIAAGAILVWGVLSLAFVVSPVRVVHWLTRGRVAMSVRTAWAFRILGVVNAYGAIHIYLRGR
jgi:hypothetical protein